MVYRASDHVKSQISEKFNLSSVFRNLFYFPTNISQIPLFLIQSIVNNQKHLIVHGYNRDAIVEIKMDSILDHGKILEDDSREIFKKLIYKMFELLNDNCRYNKIPMTLNLKLKYSDYIQDIFLNYYDDFEFEIIEQIYQKLFLETTDELLVDSILEIKSNLYNTPEIQRELKQNQNSDSLRKIIEFFDKNIPKNEINQIQEEIEKNSDRPNKDIILETLQKIENKNIVNKLKKITDKLKCHYDKRFSTPNIIEFLDFNINRNKSFLEKLKAILKRDFRTIKPKGYAKFIMEIIHTFHENEFKDVNNIEISTNYDLDSLIMEIEQTLISENCNLLLLIRGIKTMNFEYEEINQMNIDSDPNKELQIFNYQNNGENYFSYTYYKVPGDYEYEIIQQLSLGTFKKMIMENNHKLQIKLKKTYEELRLTIETIENKLLEISNSKYPSQISEIDRNFLIIQKQNLFKNVLNFNKRIRKSLLNTFGLDNFTNLKQNDKEMSIKDKISYVKTTQEHCFTSHRIKKFSEIHTLELQTPTKVSDQNIIEFQTSTKVPDQNIIEFQTSTKVPDQNIIELQTSTKVSDQNIIEFETPRNIPNQNLYKTKNQNKGKTKVKKISKKYISQKEYISLKKSNNLVVFGLISIISLAGIIKTVASTA